MYTAIDRLPSRVMRMESTNIIQNKGIDVVKHNKNGNDLKSDRGDLETVFITSGKGKTGRDNSNNSDDNRNEIILSTLSSGKTVERLPSL
jgi:hypothetical protein